MYTASDARAHVARALEQQQSLHFPTVIDSTFATDLVCETKYYWAAIRRIRPAGPNQHLVAGGAMARGYETVRRKYYGEGASLEDAILAGQYAIIEEWGNFTPTWSWDEGADVKTLDNCLLGIEHYFRIHPPTDDPYQPIMINGEPAVEFTFAIPLAVNHPETGEPILYAGRFDMIAQREGTKNDAVWAFDDKTAKQLGAQWSNRFLMRGQFIGYVFALLTYDMNCVGAVARGLGFYKTKFDVATAPISVTPRIVELWKSNLEAKLMKQIDAWHHNRYVMDFGDVCSMYNGCPFRDLCLYPPSATERIIEAEFEHNEWDPLAVD